MLLSGGIDSATCLYLSRKKGYRNRALTITFHRIAEGELNSARMIAKAAGVVEHRILRVPDLREISDIKGRGNFGELPGTYIPNRNMIFYSLAASFAEEVGADYILGGHNAQDTKTFQDTKVNFFENLQETLWSASRILKEKRTTILRPLQHMTKPEVVIRGSELGVPFEKTWSCYEEGRKHCWRCAGCTGRISAFKSAGIEDPLSGLGPKKV